MDNVIRNSGHTLSLFGKRQGKRPQRLGRIFDDTPMAWVITDPAGLIVNANHAAEAILFLSLANLRNKPFSLLVSACDRPIFATMRNDLLTIPCESSRPLCIQPRKGPQINVVFKAAIVCSADGLPEFISWVFLESLGNFDLL